LVEDMNKLLRRLLGEDVELCTKLDGGLGSVTADPGQIEQVIMNLAVNARDAMPKGGKLTLETANVELDQAYSRQHAPVRPGSYVMLAITDTGCGMSTETLSHVFEPFFTTKEQGKGTGLGLSTVYGIVKQSGGHIWVYSEPGKGTTFKIYLPRVDVGVDAPTPAAENPKVLTGTETILLAEDDAQLRRLASGLLRRLGYHVLEAASTEAALGIAAKHSGEIELILTDVVMPGASGPVLADMMSASHPRAKVLYMSGYTGDAIVNHGMLNPGLHYLQKPFTPSELSRRVRQLLDAH
jgi:CheY-like chemotaxis protein